MHGDRYNPMSTPRVGWVEGLINPGAVGQVISWAAWESQSRHAPTLPILINPRLVNPVITENSWESDVGHAPIYTSCAGVGWWR